MSRPDSFTTLEEWLPWLETLSPREIVLGLDRVTTVLERLELSRPETVIHVGGTNGKGSSAAMLESILLQNNVQTGCYSSPHIHRYNERIRVNGVDAADEQILSALQCVETVRGDVPLTFFEFGTLAALKVFDTAGADTWILEVGLGGRLDAVNAVEPDVSLITNVSLDHCAWLGDDVESIAYEKAGIMRESRPVVFGSPAVPQAITAHAENVGAKLQVAGRDFRIDAESGASDLWIWQSGQSRVADLCFPPFVSGVQRENAAAVLAVLESLGMHWALNSQSINAALADIQLAGRFQRIPGNPSWVLDVAHNPAAVDALVSRFESCSFDGQVTCVIGLLRDKDVDGVIERLRGIVDRWVAVTVAGARAESARDLAMRVSAICDRPCLIADEVPQALTYSETHSRAADTILVTGSFYLVGPALAWIESQDIVPLHSNDKTHPSSM